LELVCVGIPGVGLVRVGLPGFRSCPRSGPQARSVWGWNMVVVVARIGVGWDSFGAGLVVD